MKKFNRGALNALCLFSILGCGQAETQNIQWAPTNDKQFSDYWFQGKAELTRYALEQARYGQMHRGDAVLVFVTEDFLTDKQVKLEDYSKGKNGAVPVLKINLTKKFNTGIYPYSLMTSVFSPLDLKAFPHALKVSTSVQEWCGHVYTQINLRDGHFDVEAHSYFEKEGDERFTLDPVFVEDEIWTRIRISPSSLPTGAVKMIPGTLSARLRHKKLAAESVKASLVELDSKEGTRVCYKLEYEGRSLTINFKKNFPYEIVSWEETYLDGFGSKAQLLTTKAVKTHSLNIDYWTKNDVADSTYRKELGLGN